MTTYMAVGDDGTILKTPNGGSKGEILESTDLGATWTKGTRASKHLNAVA